MRTFFTPFGPAAAALALAALSAGCDRLPSMAATGRDDVARYEFAKDSRGHTLRLDKVTGEVTPVDKTKAPVPSPARHTAARTTPGGHARVAGAAESRADRRPGTAIEPSTSRPTPTPVRTARSQPAIVAVQPEPARIAFGGMCAEHREPVGVTLVDTAVYARPSLGTPLVTRAVSGTMVGITGDSGEWLRVNLEGVRGPLAGFIHCSALRPLTPIAEEFRSSQVRPSSR